MTEIDISIIILSKNEKDYIFSTLKSVFQQDIDKKYEVILIDSDSRDSTLSIAGNYPVKIKKISSDKFGHGKTRNYGVKISRGEYIVFLNADAVPINKYWLKNLIINLQKNENIAGVYSRIYPRDNCNPLRAWEILNDSYYFGKKEKFIDSFRKYKKMKPEEIRKFISFHTISCAMRKKVINEHPFKYINFGEDLEWSKRMMENRYKIIYEPDSGVFHSHNFYNSFNRTVKKYFDDTKLNNYLIGRWCACNIYLIFLHILYKLIKDGKYILKLEKSKLYKIWWLFYSPVIRLAELSGIVFATLNIIPGKFQYKFSLANQIIKG